MRADTTYAQALAAERANQLQAAQAGLVTTVALWSVEPTYWNELARVHVAIARAAQGPPAAQTYRDAIQAADRAWALNPASAQLWSNWGQIAGEAAVRTADADLRKRAADAVNEATRRAPGYWLANVR
jgi:hypothetical protein